MFGRKPSGPQTPAAPAPATNGRAAAKNDPAIANTGSAIPTAVGKLSPEEAQRRAVATAKISVAFAQVVSVLMRSPVHKHFSLADLEWLVVPPLLAGQSLVVEAKAQSDGPGVPIAAALWASVATEVDKRLSENVNAPVRLRPDEWKSGDILWLVEVIGDGRVVPPLLKQLSETVFKGREVKLRIQGKDGKPSVTTLQQVAAEQPQPAAQNG
jgi:hemolysin-activating ACP:hemolysin acyltransferase